MPVDVKTEVLFRFVRHVYIAHRQNIPDLLKQFSAFNTIEVAVLTWN